MKRDLTLFPTLPDPSLFVPFSMLSQLQSHISGFMYPISLQGLKIGREEEKWIGKSWKDR